MRNVDFRVCFLSFKSSYYCGIFCHLLRDFLIVFVKCGGSRAVRHVNDERLLKTSNENVPLFIKTQLSKFLNDCSRTMETGKNDNEKASSYENIFMT